MSQILRQLKVLQGNEFKNNIIMGTGKVVRCKDCGHEWSIYRGKGCCGQAAPKPMKNKEGKIVCPKCQSSNIEKTEVTILWD